MVKQSFLFTLCVTLFFQGCKREAEKAKLAFEYQFNADQVRLNNLGQPTALPAGHAALTPDFRKMSVHYIELAPSAFTLLGQGEIVYHGAETTKGGENAVDFDKAPVLAAGQEFAEIDLAELAPGTYEWVRVSVTYQNYDIRFTFNDGTNTYADNLATVASFVGFNTYISTVTPFEKPLVVNANKKQGFWGLETRVTGPYAAYNRLVSGQAPDGATTVVNPLFATSPVPQGSCVVTGKFAQPLVITGNETGKLKIKLSFSVNKSFEWKDTNGNNKWDLYLNDPQKNEPVVDMGLRGLVPEWSWE